MVAVVGLGSWTCGVVGIPPVDSVPELWVGHTTTLDPVVVGVVVGVVVRVPGGVVAGASVTTNVPVVVTGPGDWVGYAVGNGDGDGVPGQRPKSW